MIRKLIVAAIFAAALLAASSKTVFGDGSDPMPACRKHVCPPIGDRNH